MKQIPLIALIGGVGMLSLEAGMRYGLGNISACFVGTCIVAVLSEFASRAGRDATTVFILPGIIPFVPGALIYRSVDAVLNANYIGAAGEASKTFFTAGSIAAALIVVASLTRLTVAVINRIRRKAEQKRMSDE
jgi:uncharacterized membrane protein YjjB (DUF3815 family)